MNIYDSEIEMSEDINVLMKNYEKNKEKYRTKPVISKYEKTRILSERANQINNGSKIFIDTTKDNAYNIALEEYELKKIPFIIKRKLPDNKTIEYWKVIDLIDIS